MSEGETPANGTIVPEARLRESGKPPANQGNEIDRRAVLRIGATTAMALGTVALGIGLMHRDGRSKKKTLPKLKDHRVA
jgi:hypothetical protein